MIVNRYEVTWKLWHAYMWETKLHGTKLVVFVALILMGLLGIAEGIVLGISLLPIFLVAYSLVFAFGRDYYAAVKQYRFMQKLCAGKPWIRTIRISKDEITVEDATNTADFPTSDIAYIRLRGDEMCLVLNNRIKVRLYRNAFEEGSFDVLQKRFHKYF